MSSWFPSARSGSPAFTNLYCWLRERRVAIWRRFPAAYAGFGPRSKICRPIIRLGNPRGIRIGADVLIQGYAILESSSEGNLTALTIGDGTYIGFFSRITAVEQVSIGGHVMVSDRVYISDSGHNYEDVHRPIVEQGLRRGRRVAIGDGVWIGAGAVIVGNVLIGEGAVVGANAVVRDDVAPHTVVSGNPARVIRYYDGMKWRSRPS